MKKLIVAATLTLLMSGPAFANHCPVMMKAIDEALAKNPQLTAEQLAEVKEYRAEGETLHSQGLHNESMAALKKAEDILGISE